MGLDTRFADMFGSLPTAERLAFDIRSWGSVPGYSQLFGRRLENVLGIPAHVVEEVAGLPEDHYRREAVARLSEHTKSASEIVADLRAGGATVTVIHNPLPTRPQLSNDELAELVGAFPIELRGFGRIDLSDPNEAALEVRRVASLGLAGITMTPFWHSIQANAEALEPVYRACTDTGLPVWVHTSMQWSRAIPLSVEHPLYLDEVAARHPDLTIIAGHGGWPWIADMVAVAWRQANVYIDTSAFRPRHIATPGSGWEMLWYQMSRNLIDKVVMGSTWQLFGMSLEEVILEARGLELNDRAKAKWMYENLAQILKYDQ